MNKKNPIRLSTKAMTALRNVYDPSFKIRTKKLEDIQEYSFSILLYWNQIESLIKLLKYYKKIDEEYPDKLNFINRSWGILKNLHQANSNNYIIIFADGKKTSESLWGTRDRIAHASHIVTKEEYNQFKESAIWVFSQLFTNMAETFDLAHNQYLTHKKSKVLASKKINKPMGSV
ncbi:hypothetical protein AU255_06865 [Methyloprofundus sedimenti]|uniref:RiboL-PSP-HEPN domain-containing protein n=1 Tax=Methyloprofundus sedimenti TaxID=1420851 RepID=A0A1V8M7U8_9GAMM|nr:hypothetical protein [Methyloprofundus sedimenti]OQK17586.1 hypothetical protein AU255_06865 [Methyloprofundus sedimenti]